ncbi:MAG: dicarboxylate/amino acid:cation symporter [bacterium]
MKFSEMSLSARIFTGMILGLLTGLLINNFLGDVAFVQIYLTDGLFQVVGQVFLRSLQMLVIPLVFVSLVSGSSALADPKQLARLGGKSMLLYLFTTAVAISLALVFAVIVQPGVGIELISENYVPKEAPAFVQVVLNMFPKNPIQAMAEGKMLQVIIFAIFFGVAITMSGESGQRVRSIIGDFESVIMKLVAIVMHLAPFGVFALIARLFAGLGYDGIKPLMSYFFLVLFVLFVHALVIYPTLLKSLTGLNPITFLKKLRPAMLVAFSTASSGATMPVTMRVVEKRLGVSNSTASFTVPLGATINMDGTAIMQGVATAFIAQAYGIDLTFGQYIMVIVMAVMASIGTAAVPGVGLIMLVQVLNQVGLPVEGIAMIIGVDRLLDMTRTAVNVTGDAMVSTIVDKSEKGLDLEVFNDPDADMEEA